MRILMLTPYLPYPPASGGQIRTLYLLKYLKRNNSITLVSLYKNEAEKKYAKQLEDYCDKIYLCKRPSKPWQIDNILKSIFSNLPFLVVRNYSKEALKTVSDLLKTEDFDVIHAETFYIMPHIPKTNLPVLLVEQTIEYKVYQHFIANLPFYIKTPLTLDILKLKYWEKFYWKKANTVATVSKFDKDEIKNMLPEIEPEIIPNGAGDAMFVKTLPTKKSSNKKLLFLGNFFWLQNVEAAEYLINKVFPKLQKKIPNVELIIAGQNAKDKIKNIDIKNIKIINLSSNDEDKVKKLYLDAAVFLAPIFGPGGTRLKILASMASGLPVVSTKVGVEGLNGKNREHFLVAKNSNEFVKETVSLLENKDLYKSIQKNSFELVTKNFSWKYIAKKLEYVYQEMITKHDV